MEDTPVYLTEPDVRKQISAFEAEFGLPFLEWNRQQWLKVALVLSGTNPVPDRL